MKYFVIPITAIVAMLCLSSVSEAKKPKPPIYTAAEKELSYTFTDESQVNNVVSPIKRSWGTLVDVHVTKKKQQWTFDATDAIRIVNLKLKEDDSNNTYLTIDNITKIIKVVPKKKKRTKKRRVRRRKK